MQRKRSVLYLFCTSTFLLLLSCSLLLKKINSRTSELPDSAMMLLSVENTTKLLPGSASTSSNRNSAIFEETTTAAATGAATQSSKRKGSRRCTADTAGALKVYMYDLPAKFHFGLLGWPGQAWPNVSAVSVIPPYPGGLHQQHSIEYWLTLDILSSESESESDYPTARPCVAAMTKNWTAADVIFVPFFSSVSYNRHSRVQGDEKVSYNRALQKELVEYLMARPEWKRNGGRDHVIMAHHPNSMDAARRKLRSARFVLSDFGRYNSRIANLKKDIIAPYKHVVHSVGLDQSPGYDSRPMLAFFQGSIHRKDGGAIREKLYHLLRDEEDVHFTSGPLHHQSGVRQSSKGMASSKFCLHIAGDTPSSNRLFDAIVTHCVPVVISDDVELPFEDVLDYSDFCVFVRAADALKDRFLVDLLRGISRREWTRMWWRLKQVAPHFEYQFPSRQGDAVQMLWEAIARKVKKVGSENLFKHKKSRFFRAHVGM